MGTRNRHAFHFPVQKFDDRVGLWKNFRYLEDFLQQISNDHSSNVADIVVAPSDTREGRFADVVLSGTADQTQLNTVFADASANDLWVHILSGTVNLTGSIDLNTAGAMKVTGAGITDTVIRQFSGTSDMILGNAQTRTYWSDMTWDGNANATTAFLSGLGDGHELHLFRVEITGCTSAGINFNRGAAAAVILECLVHDNTGLGLSLAREDVALIQSCDIYDNTGVGIQPGGAGGERVTRILDNSIVGNAHGIVSSGGSHRSEDLVIIGNSIEGNTGNSIDVIGTDHVIIGNRFVGNGTNAPVVLAGSVVMANNVGGTPTTIAHISTGGITADDHHNEAHTVVSHSDTTATGLELDELTDGSESTLHSHSGTTDADAIHDNVAGEIAAITDKASPVGADHILIEDSAAGDAKKSVSITNLPGGADADAIHDNVGSEISAITDKGTPVNGDFLIIEDSASSNAKKSITIGNLPGSAAGDDAPDWVTYLDKRLADETGDADDDFFGDATKTGWTESVVTGNATWTELRGVMSLEADSGATGDAASSLKAITAVGPPLTIESAVRMFDINADFHTMGICFTDGTTSSSNVVQARLASRANGTDQMQSYTGTLTDTDNTSRVLTTMNGVRSGLLYMRLVWTASNTWAVNFSQDSVSWSDLALAPFSFTMTPTHFGMFATNFASTTIPLIASWEYFRVYESDLDV